MSERNPWAERLGCEMNVCQADNCNPERMSWCDLRRYYLERVRGLRELHQRARSRVLRASIERQLRGLDAWD